MRRHIVARLQGPFLCEYRKTAIPLCALCVRSFSTNISSRKPHTSSDQTYYDQFPGTIPDGPPPQGAFSLNGRALRTEFLKKQQSIHPDLFPQSQKIKAESASADLNKAYSTLLDPLSRAQYILSLRGVDLANDESTDLKDEELLMDVMEAREVIEEAESEDDLVDVQKENDERLDNSVRILEDAFKQDDLDTAKKETIRLRYWMNIKNVLRDWEPGKEIVLHH